jgi:hypothetical protein
MKINSLSLKTNMIFARSEGEIIPRESYIVIKTMNNPTFHWGNYLIFKKAPVDGDIANWINIFQKEFSHYKTFEHYVFAWDELAEPASVEYLSYNFNLEKSVSCYFQARGRRQPDVLRVCKYATTTRVLHRCRETYTGDTKGRLGI